MAGNWRTLIVGGAAGAVLVGLLAGALGELLRDLAHPAVLIAFILFGAVLGAFAWGAVAYERDRELPAPSARYREGILAERELEGEPEPEPAAEPRSGLLWLLRNRAQRLLKLPLNPWI